MVVDANRTNRSLGGFATLGSNVGAGKSKRLLVPLDGSGLAETVLSHTASLARASSSLLTLLQVIPPFVFYDPMGTGAVLIPTAWEAWEEEPRLAREYLQGVADALNKQGVNADTIVLNGDPAGTIVEYTKQHPEVRMIAMATYEHTGIRRWIVGSVADRVLHSSPVPLLLVGAFEQDISVAPSPMGPAASVGSVVPASAAHEEQRYGTILVPLDGSRFAEQALDQAQVLAAQFDATLLLVSVVPPFEYVENTVEAAAISPWVDNAEDKQAASMVRYLSDVAQRLRSKGLKVQPEVVPGNAAEEIARRSEAGKADLIVMASHGRTGVQRLWLGSVAMKVVHAAKVPVLLVRVSEMAEGTTDKMLAITSRV